MSRIGNRILTIPNGVSVEIASNEVILKAGANSLVVKYPSNLLKVEQKDATLVVVRLDEKSSEANMFQGTVNANLANALIGLSKGFTIDLELKGVGYRAKVEGSKLTLSLGFSHPVVFDIPKTLKIEIPSQTEIKITGADKAEVGQFAADIRKYRKPEPYKGKGVLFKGEQVVRKAGKTADKKK
ncbi:50S ribosomal protein L6 [Ureaplasma ceti]|uniref:50S ribosomal protein L6 n=1 Tax=Ureaplasma ceti TaxID=3119530 RepID=A0ABP9U8I7_9BACT